jgi:hypothetical protein
MSDPLAVALARLAPTVDVAASRALLDRSLDGAAGAAPPPSNRRRLLAAACVALLAAGAVGVWAVSGRDEADAPAAPTTVFAGRGEGTEFRVVATEPVGNVDASSIRSAGTEEELISIVSRFGPDFAPFAADVDLTREVALVIERPDNSCPAEIDRFEPVDDTWRVVWRKPDGNCEDVGLGWVYLVAIDRSALSGIEWFVLPAGQQGSVTWDELQVAVPEEPTTPPLTEQAALDAATTLVLEAQSSAEPGTAAGAATALQYEAMWSRFLAAPEAPAIDFTTDVAIAFMMLDDGCVAEFRGLTVSRTESGSTRLVPRFREPGASECNDVGFLRFFVLTVERDVLPDAFEFYVPQIYTPSTQSGMVTTIDLSAPATSSTTLGLDPALLVASMSFAPSDATLAALESRLGFVNMFSQVDLEQFAVIAFAVAPGECADTFDRFDIDDDGVWTPVFREPGVCDAALPRLVAVSVDREALVGGVTFRYRDAVLAVDPDYAIVDATWACGPEDSRQFTITLDLPPNGDVAIDVVAGDVVGGSARVQVGSNGLVSSTGFGVTGIEPTVAQVVVSDKADDRVVARMSLGHLPVPTCP